MKPYTCGPSVSEATIIGATDSWAWTQSVHVFTEPRPGTHMLPAKAVHEFTRTNRKSSVKSGEEGRGCGGPGEEFRVDFHSAVPAALNLQREGERGEERERERGGKMQSGHCCAERASVLEAAVAVCASEMSIKRELFFDWRRRAGSPEEWSGTRLITP